MPKGHHSGPRGPKKKPTALRVLEGNPGRQELNPLEPHVERLPVMPSAVAMDETAAKEWVRICEVMPVGVYTAADESVLTEYVTTWSLLVGAIADIQLHGRLIYEPIVNKDGEIVGHKMKENPALRTWRAAHTALMHTTDRLGLSPGQRSRLQVPSKKQVSKFGDLIG